MGEDGGGRVVRVRAAAGQHQHSLLDVRRIWRRRRNDPGPLVAQPAIAARARRHAQMIKVGVVFALVGAAAMVGSSVTRLRLTDVAPVLPAAGNAAAVVAALVALLQNMLWRRAVREWEGIEPAHAHAWYSLSANGRWLAIIAAGITAWSAQQTMIETTRAEAAWWLAFVGALAALAGVALAGVQRLRPDGPPGVPAHIRRNHRLRQPSRTGENR
ncbi:hypothetical protein ACQB6R_12150 [Propionibacteriaceae bacterium G1746]|uniref:hypothetical protein n=1 Tax=Aestuariimicrobium sp. G57 TaxID=3418485 RepID=UPI003C1D0A11